MLFWWRVWDRLKETPITRLYALIGWCDGVFVGVFLSWVVYVWLFK